MSSRAGLLTHRREGSGPPVLLLNGGMMSFPAWEKVAAPLREHYELLLFDFRGQLLSPGPAPTSLAGHADDVLALLDAMGWAQAHCVGTSFGAEVALELAAKAGDRVASLTLITAMDRATPDFTLQSREMRQVLAEIAAGGGKDDFYDLLTARVYSSAYRAAEADLFAARRVEVARLPLAWYAGVDALLGAIEAFDLTPLLPQITCPSLVVVAGADEVMAAERSLALAAALGAQVRTHPTAGHALVAEDPNWLAATCLEFLTQVAPLAKDAPLAAMAADPRVGHG